MTIIGFGSHDLLKKVSYLMRHHFLQSYNSKKPFLCISAFIHVHTVQGICAGLNKVQMHFARMSPKRPKARELSLTVLPSIAGGGGHDCNFMEGAAQLRAAVSSC